MDVQEVSVVFLMFNLLLLRKECVVIRKMIAATHAVHTATRNVPGRLPGTGTSLLLTTLYKHEGSPANSHFSLLEKVLPKQLTVANS